MEVKKNKMKAELIIMDINNLKPNYAEIGRKYKKDYRTVKRYHEGYEGNPKTRNKPSKLDQYYDEIVLKLSIPRTSIKSVYEFMVDKYGYENIGSYSNLKTYVRNNKLNKPNQSNSHTRFETDPGDLAECDWKENITIHSKDGNELTVNIFHLILKFSHYSYIELTISKEQKDVFRCMINAFRFFGGVPVRVLFDNMTTAAVVNGPKKRVNDRMKQFAKDMMFDPQLCKVEAPYTKGTNESRNKILDWIRPYDYEIDDFMDLSEKVKTLNQKMNLELCQGTGLPPCVLFVNEKEYLHPLPAKSVIDDYLAPAKVKVNQNQLIYYKGIWYSVDKSLIGEYVQPEEFNDQLQIYYKGKLVQVHTISKNPINYTHAHYKQSIGNKVDEDKIETMVSTNLEMMDSILDRRKVTITKENAIRSVENMNAYLVSQGSLSNYIKRYIYSLTSDQQCIFYEEMNKLLPYVENEDVFFEVFKYASKVRDIRNIRRSFWEEQYMNNNVFLSDDGFEKIYEEFKDQIDEIIDDIRRQLNR